jgi:hypothetical protein
LEEKIRNAIQNGKDEYKLIISDDAEGEIDIEIEFDAEIEFDVNIESDIDIIDGF